MYTYSCYAEVMFKFAAKVPSQSCSGTLVFDISTYTFSFNYSLIIHVHISTYV